ncbi:hypothetical protein B6I21_08565 [candidate division KSB1 bacterium 4572_119]|nr:MAG: hypothetical protein B6I21_08565 [candidate division KSB1 bacterium 4572_119]
MIITFLDLTILQIKKNGDNRKSALRFMRMVRKEILKYFLFLHILTILLSGKLFAQGGTVLLEAKVDRNKITIGDLIKYSIVVTSDENIEIQMPDLGANLGAFEIRDYVDSEPSKKDGQIIQVREYIISTYDIGDYQIPPVTVSYRVGEDSVWKDLTTENLKITVESLVASEEGDIRDIKPPLEIPKNWWRTIRFAVAGLLVLLVIVLVFIYLKRRKQGKSLIPRREKPTRPPHETAIEELEKLIQEQLLEKGETKEYYIRISEIIRQYIEDRFFIIALEMTTHQLIESMKESEVEPEVCNEVEKFLNQCDLVKFAKYKPNKTANKNTTKLAFKIIEQTKLIFTAEQDETEKNVSIEVVDKKEEPGEAVTDLNDADDFSKTGKAGGGK